MFNKEYLESLLIIGDDLSQQDRMSLLSLRARGLPYYGRLNTEFKTHWISFTGMHTRLKQSGLDCDFPRTATGFIEYILYLGPVPPDMIQPTAGRSDHSKGYITGNFQWQSMSDNSSEGGSRGGSALKSSYNEDFPLANRLKGRRKKIIRVLSNCTKPYTEHSYKQNKLHSDPIYTRAVIEFPELFI